MTEESKKELRERHYEERRERERRKAKKGKQTKTSASQNPVVQPEIPKSREGKAQVQEVPKELVEIPVINLKRPAISFKTAPLTLDYPEGKKERQLIVPKFKAIFPTFEFSSAKLDASFSIERKIRSLIVPKIRLLKPIVEFSEDELDANYSISKREREVFIPKFVSQKPSMSFETASLNTEVLTFQSSHQPAQFTAQVQNKNVGEANRKTESIQSQEEIIGVTQVPVEAQARSEKEEVGGEELQDPLEFLFGEGAGKIRDVEPLVILFKDYKDDSYIQTLETLLLRIYREKHGGYPDTKKLTLNKNSDDKKDNKHEREWDKREIEQWLDEGKLFLIDLGEGGKTEVKLSADMLADRLWAIFSKKRGIVIFYTKDDKLFSEYSDLLDGIKWNKLHLGAEIIKLVPRRLSFEEKLKLADLLFGFVDIREEVPPSASMDDILNASEGKYKKKLKKLENKYYAVFGIVKPGENESDEHRRGKAFIVHWLIRQLEEKGMIPKEDKKKDWKLIKDTIKTEEPKNGVIVDVCFGHENYEFETLFEEGFGKIHKTLRKYEQSQANVEIVVEPITAFLHVNEFAKLMKIVKQVYPTLNVKFYTLSIKNEKLMSLEKYLKEVKTLTKLNIMQ